MRHRALLFLSPCLLLAACGGGSPGAAPAAATPGADPNARTDASDEAVVVSTNEPFWQARVDGLSIVLSGIDDADRRLAVASSSMTSEGYRTAARDAAGEVIVIVKKMRCQDDMSGAEFPMTGTITIDGVGPIRGCARPASMPLPSEAASAGVDAAIPARWRARWAPDAAACANPDASIEGLTITADALRFHESLGAPTEVELIDQDTLRITSAHDGEGQQWTSTQTLRLEQADSMLLVEGPGDAKMHRVRCHS